MRNIAKFTNATITGVTLNEVNLFMERCLIVLLDFCIVSSALVCLIIYAYRTLFGIIRLSIVCTWSVNFRYNFG